MLQSLTIDSFAIIDHVEIDFSNGMTVLSGETGAGKSIIIDALGMLCGGRGSNEYIRQDSDKLVIEGLFLFEEISAEMLAVLEELSIDTTNLLADGLIIRREITNQGKNIIRVNGQLTNVTGLKKLGAHLVDIHGQNEHQALLDNTQHLELIDQLGDADFLKLKADYQQAYEVYRTMRRTWLESQKNEKDQLQRLSFLEFQVNEIEAANLEAEEYEQLESTSKKLQNAATIAQSIDAINYLMSDSDTSVLSQWDSVIDELSKIKNYDESYPEILAQLKSMRIEMQEAAHQLALSSDDSIYDDQTIDEIEGRLNELEQLKRKYGMDIAEIIEYYQEISEEIYQVKHREDYLLSLSKQFKTAYDKVYQLSVALTAARQQLATQLIEQIEQELVDLYMPNSRFQVNFAEVPTEVFELEGIGTCEWLALTQVGKDSAEFFAITNLGEPSKPLVKVASGGELSRFMLALKAVFSRQVKGYTMVFDEIDTGVSGRVAQAIAEKIAQISQNNQVLCITHLAQVAAIAQEQLYINKQVANNRTSTQVSVLDEQQRIEILAQMMSGKKVTESSLVLAKELLQEMAELTHSS